MTSKRPAIPKAVKETVLKEFNHLCSICGAASPQLHHIDEDNANNDRLNLLPLCPNHHLTDQHNPTSKIDPRILRLFRIHRDPTILTPQFQPLFRRIAFLEDGSGQTYTRSEDLVRFVATLEMGEYYSEQIRGHLEKARYLPPDHEPDYASHFDPGDKNAARRRASEQVFALVLELLKFQPWRTEKRSKNGSH